MARFLFCFALIMIGTCFFAANAQAEACARMEKKFPWDRGTEIPLDCERVSKAIIAPLKDIPDLKALAGLSYAEAQAVLGPPYHQYVFNHELIAFFQKNALLIIRYDQNGNLPSTIIFSIAGHFEVDEIPSLLNLGPAPSPFNGPVGPFWNDLGGFAQVELHNPDYKYKGEYIYPLILHVNEYPIPLGWAEKIKRAQ